MPEQEIPGTGSAGPLAFVGDLIFASRVRGAAQAVGVAAEVLQSPDKVLERARSRRPPLILVDVEARGGAGVELVRRLKEEPATADVPVVAFASHRNTAAIEAARAAGADRVLARSAFVKALPELLRSR
ncbi:MAG TPA: response regulator [Longimicrobiales bacterium]|nr:response regulator [Longimicrobiales bacterium]